ncbi:hypothetical protein LX16_4849 [Stackebrandtia albiflava]|uniref:Acetyltransferase (GNAT) family protein n=1 Tax=Stackebrandtia albiflava TaxID=406432 RepID=A0A562UPZ3_9ACTN|nr:N-acetyltransferase [Stackebrandtia albiflava]TWJ07690.1 hypothetical protein LX16_4849 [Stackebrandtia albiflava]
MNVTITRLSQSPDLATPMWQMPDTWPAFVAEDLVGWSYFTRIPTTFADFVLVATDDTDGEVVARAFSVPFALHVPGRQTLPSGGWGRVIQWAFSDALRGRDTDTVSAIEITVRPDRQGRGLAGRMLAAMRDNATDLGYTELVAPLRPTLKHLEPHVPMPEYAYRADDEGIPFDPWIRTHLRAGAVIDSVATHSMVVAGSLAQWREWTGQPFDTDGPQVVPQALSPVRCDLAEGYAVYVEPNVWVRHALTSTGDVPEAPDGTPPAA